MDFIVFASAYLECIFEYIERNVIAVIGVEVVVIEAGRFRGLENYLEVTVARAIDLALTGPPVERLVITRPGCAPIGRVPPGPEIVCQRLVRLGPNQIAFVFP